MMRMEKNYFIFQHVSRFEMILSNNIIFFKNLQLNVFLGIEPRFLLYHNRIPTTYQNSKILDRFEESWFTLPGRAPVLWVEI